MVGYCATNRFFLQKNHSFFRHLKVLFTLIWNIESMIHMESWTYNLFSFCCMLVWVFGVTQKRWPLDSFYLEIKFSYPRHIKYYRLLSAICGPSAPVMHDPGCHLHWDQLTSTDILMSLPQGKPTVKGLLKKKSLFKLYLKPKIVSYL